MTARRQGYIGNGSNDDQRAALRTKQEHFSVSLRKNKREEEIVKRRRSMLDKGWQEKQNSEFGALIPQHTTLITLRQFVESIPRDVIDQH